MGSSASVVVTDVTVYTEQGWASGEVVVRDGVVVALAAGPEHADLPRFDGGSGYLLPGFVNTHTHLQQAVLRGVGEGLPLLEWLRCVGEHTVAATPEQTYLSALAGGLELLRSGVTTVVEHLWPNPSDEIHQAMIRALDELGIRVVLGRGIADRADSTRKWGLDPRLLQPLDEALAHVDALDKQLVGTRITTALAVPNPRCLTPDGMAAAREYAGATGKMVSIHLLETTTDEDMCRLHAGTGAVDYLDASGFLWDRTLAVHCVNLDAAGRAVLAERGVTVSYNPVSNMRLGSGVAPVPQMLAAGIDVTLGVDGAASNDTQDMLLALRLGAFLQRAAHRRADLLDAHQMLRMATGAAGRAVGGPTHTGIAVGDRADLTLVRFDRDFACLPVLDPGATLLTAASPRVIDTVWVDGEAVLRDGRSTRVDADDLTQRLIRMR
ncbi:amidohydrolase [Nocardia neocaledoniensis NBRC 108232]|uniref:5-methylthioadenosine/S-adenosylhomocysteine deaminase n=1 Tax=Nocardia neocaledoniensis TaxID=236511 RepID=A0A317NEY4_9NOCA|nr:amidohydrolase family protein [Nocardia neocaledoniensis]PWV73729.1 5-methylthioadenosine/S-adenosylhomocysteine deaminase [Nocardia neocaledoniensis]GEM29715.1 amidohydrolase [Nocardia neocaledoniensis NBRC 108232]